MFHKYILAPFHCFFNYWLWWVSENMSTQLECLKVSKAAKFEVFRSDLYGGRQVCTPPPPPPHTNVCTISHTTLKNNIFTPFARIILKLGKLCYFKAFFTAVLIDIHLLLFVKSWKTLWKSLLNFTRRMEQFVSEVTLGYFHVALQLPRITLQVNSDKLLHFQLLRFLVRASKSRREFHVFGVTWGLYRWNNSFIAYGVS